MLLKTAKKRRLAVLLALPVCALIGLRRYVAAVASAPALPQPVVTTAAGAPETLEQALAAAKREGFALTAQDLQAPLPPPEQNAAPLYMELAPYSSEPPWSAPEAPGESLPSEAQVAAMRQSLIVNADNTDRIHQAAARPRCVFLRDWAQPAGLTWPEYAHMRTAVDWLAAESMILLHDGKPLEAIRTQALGFAIARHVAQEPTPFAYFTACAIQVGTLRGLQNLLFLAGPNARVADAAREIVEQNRARFTLTHGLHGNMAEVLMMMKEMRAAYPKEIEHLRRSPGAPRSPDGTVPAALNAQELAKRIDRGELLTIQQMRGLASAMERPYRDAQAAMSKLDVPVDVGPPDSAASFQFFSPRLFLQGPQMAARLRAREESVRAAGALLAYKAAHGAFPNDLKAALDPMPSDPFGTGALGYRKEGAGFVLYSVGATGKYDGKGEPEAFSAETSLRYSLPASSRP